MTQGTGVGAYFGKLSGGKTGTTDNFADAWFSGFVPGLEATIWLGYPKGEIPMLSVHGISVSGPTFPATIWKLFMERASYYAPFPKEFPTPKSSPIWVTRQLQYAMTGGTYSPSSSSGTAQTTTTTTGSGSGNSDGFSQVPGDGTQP
jgi:penicillin-binding protein 1A